MNLVSPTEAAELLGVSESSVRRWIDAGLMKAYRTIGNHRRVEMEELRRFASERGLPFMEQAAPKEPATGGIVLVDDDPSNIELIKARCAVSLPGVPFASTANSFEAGVLVATQKPAVLILDLKMPQVNGVDVCRMIKGQQAAQPVHIVAYTGYASERDLVDAFLAAGGTKVFSKPDQLNTLVDFLVKLTEEDDGK